MFIDSCFYIRLKYIIDTDKLHITLLCYLQFNFYLTTISIAINFIRHMPANYHNKDIRPKIRVYYFFRHVYACKRLANLALSNYLYNRTAGIHRLPDIINKL